MMMDPAKPETLLRCPLSRTFAASPASASCIGPLCALWRWEKITTAHPLWKDAVKAKAVELGEAAPYPKASKWVAENKADLGMVPERGYCGAGGEP
jgi:hypothetical protein